MSLGEIVMAWADWLVLALSLVVVIDLWHQPRLQSPGELSDTERT